MLTLRTVEPRLAGWRERLFRRFEPPVSLKLAEWAESNIVLPAGQNARTGAFRNWPYMREILDAIGAPSPEYVTLMKPSRVGFTKALMIAIGATVMIDPCPIGSWSRSTTTPATMRPTRSSRCLRVRRRYAG